MFNLSISQKLSLDFQQFFFFIKARSRSKQTIEHKRLTLGLMSLHATAVLYLFFTSL